MGILLYVADRTGSFGTGGLAVAALSIGGGLGGPLVGLAADWFGQRLVMLLATVVQGLSLGAFLVLGPDDVLAVTLGLSVLVGVANPQAGAIARSRWAALGRTRRDRPAFTTTAMAWEGAIDETSFVVGPVLVSTVAGLTEPALGLLLALVLAALTQAGFALHPSALPGQGSRSAGTQERRTPLPLIHFGSLLVAMAAVGLVFGATQAGVAARMSLAGYEELTGPVYAAMGIGSAVTGLLTTRLPRALGLEARISSSGGLIAVGGLVSLVTHHPALLALSCLLLGIALAPALVSCYALAERAARVGWATTTMSALATANVVGVAAGAAAAGVLVDRVSPGGALLVDVVAGALVLVAGLVALLGRPRRAPAEARALPCGAE